MKSLITVVFVAGILSGCSSFGETVLTRADGLTRTPKWARYSVASFEEWASYSVASFEEGNRIKFVGNHDLDENQRINLTGPLKEDWYDRFNRLSQEAKLLRSIIDETDKKIDSLVYKLYGLTKDEIAEIEKN